MKALLFAAGKGTRLRPFTDSHPKALARVNGVTLLERNIKYLQSFGIQNFVINIYSFGEQIVNFLKENNNFGANIDISDESAGLLETGGGLLFAKRFLEKEDNFLVMNVDILTNLNMDGLIKSHVQNQNFITLAVSERDSSRKLFFNEDMVLKGWINKNTGEQRLAEFNRGFKALAFSGIHCMSSEIFSKMTRKGKFSIMLEYLDLMMTEKIIGYEHHAYLVDVGRPESILVAEDHFK